VRRLALGWRPVSTHNSELPLSEPSTEVHVLCVVRSTAHLTYVQSVLEELLRRRHRLTLLFDEAWSKKQHTALLDSFVEQWPDVGVGWLRRREGRLRGALFASRELRSYGEYVRRLGLDSKYTLRWRQYLPPWAKRASRGDYRLRGRALVAVLRRPASDRAFGLLERFVPADGAVAAHLREIRPDVVLVTPANLRFDEEIEYVKAASAMGVPSAVLVLTWDNLTTKGRLHVKPSLLLAWNEAQAREAEQLHRVPRSRISIVGSPFFDKWLDHSAEPEPRAAFLGRLGVSPDHPVVLYLGSSKHIAPDEGWVVQELARALRASPDRSLRQTTVLVRPHPFNHEAHESCDKPGVVVWPSAVSLPELAGDQRDFASAIAHATCAVGLNTSAMIDAVTLDKPVLTSLVDRYADTQRSAEHFRHLADSGAIEVVSSFDELVERIARVVHGEDVSAPGRTRFVEQFLRPRGREISAARASVDEVISLTRGR
jgi:hypothetical protein